MVKAKDPEKTRCARLHPSGPTAAGIGGPLRIAASIETSELTVSESLLMYGATHASTAANHRISAGVLRLRFSADTVGGSVMWTGGCQRVTALGTAPVRKAAAQLVWSMNVVPESMRVWRTLPQRPRNGCVAVSFARTASSVRRPGTTL